MDLEWKLLAYLSLYGSFTKVNAGGKMTFDGDHALRCSLSFCTHISNLFLSLSGFFLSKCLRSYVPISLDVTCDGLFPA